MSTSSTSLLNFPCDFPIKIFGKRTDDFAQQILEVVLQHVPDFVAETIEMRSSEHKNYISLTCTVFVTSREQLDNLYRALHQHPAVKLLL